MKDKTYTLCYHAVTVFTHMEFPEKREKSKTGCPLPLPKLSKRKAGPMPAKIPGSNPVLLVYSHSCPPVQDTINFCPPEYTFGTRAHESRSYIIKLCPFNNKKLPATLFI